MRRGGVGRTRGGRKVLRPTLDDKRSVEARSRSNRQPFCRWVPPIVTVRGGCYFLFRSAVCFPCAPTYAHARQRSARGEADDERRLHVGRADHHLGVGREDAVPSITQHLGRQRHLHLHAHQKEDTCESTKRGRTAEEVFAKEDDASHRRMDIVR